MKARVNSNVPLLLLLATTWVLPTMTCQASVDSFLDGQIKIIEHNIFVWERTGHSIEWLTYAVVAIGIIVAALQAAKKNWAKAGVAILGVASSLIVGFTHIFFPADDRAYQKVARHARSRVHSFSLQLAQYRVLDDETRNGLYENFAKLQQDLDDFENATIYGGIASTNNTAGTALNALFVATARADQQTDSSHTPVWVQKLPSDDRNIYFVGIGEATTYAVARDNAQANARKAVAGTVTKAVSASPSLARQPELVEKLANSLAASAEIVETFTAPTAEGRYQGFILVRISKSAATFTAQSVFVQSGVPYDKAFLDHLKQNGR